MAERDYEDFDEHGNIIFNELDAYRVKPGLDFDTGLMNMTDSVLYALRKIGFSRADTCANIQNGVIRIKDGLDNIWQIKITKE